MPMDDKAASKPNKDKPPQYPLPKKVAILYSDVKREYFPTEEQFITEKEAKEEAQVVANYLEKMGVSAQLFPGNPDVVQSLRKSKPDMVINMVSSIRGQEFLSASIPGTLELLEIPYTGAGILAESIVYNKFLTKKLLQQNGVPVPNYQLFNTPQDKLDQELRFPLISKLNEIHGAVEITKDAVSDEEKHLRERLKFLINTYKQPVLVEEFIVGREITCFLIMGLNKKVYMAEKIFDRPGEKYVFATYEDQWGIDAKTSYHYEKYEDPILREYVKKAFEITKMDDYGKFDVRLDSSGRYFFIDSNSNPAFGPAEADCALGYVTTLYGVDFEEILRRLLINTMFSPDPKTNGNSI